MSSPHRLLSVLLTFVLCAACGGTTTVAGNNPPLVPSPAPTATSVAQPTRLVPPSTPVAPTPEPAATQEPAPSAAVGLDVLVAADLAPLQGKRVGVIANQTSRTSDDRHIIDVLQQHPAVDLVTVFAPEHGVRGVAGAGEAVGDTVDDVTGIPIRSLYGSTRSPVPADLAAIDVLVYDLQDVGTRFYTYISTMGLAMAVAEDAGVQFMVLDRPNPLGGEMVAGFMRTADQESFISQYPIPAVYGLTAGELATMIAAEGWVDGRVLSPPIVVQLTGWDRSLRWPALDRPWTAPSPGLPTVDAALIYPGTVLFEATTLDFGRGTDAPFTRIAASWINTGEVVNQLQSVGLPGVWFGAPTSGVAGIEIFVGDPAVIEPSIVGVHLIVALHRHAIAVGQPSIIDRAPTFDLLAGTTQLRSMIEAGAEPDDIVASWQAEVVAFRTLRSMYLRY